MSVSTGSEDTTVVILEREREVLGRACAILAILEERRRGLPMQISKHGGGVDLVGFEESDIWAGISELLGEDDAELVHIQMYAEYRQMGQA